MTTYTVAGGCFWCIDGVFQRILGVEASVCGYAGGSAEDAEYYRVASGKTGHAEAVQITFDEKIIPADVVLDIFFLVHNPTTLNQQGNDVGPQYRSALFYKNLQQKAEFEAAVKRAENLWSQPIVTEISSLEKFYPAEPEHQDYFTNNPDNPYCSVVVAPKISKARQQYAQWFKEE